ncbi:MAG: DUF342 domain-containing protein [Syntrophomonadaceae bacterium]|nr:DUF342 domain-containing protein [Syntrophomonadaceae bacterium]
MSDLKLSQDGYVKVHISDDGMAAYVTVYGPKNGGRSVTMQDVLNAVKDAGVVEGIDYGRLADCLKEENLNRPVLVAKGTEAQDGIDGRLEYQFARRDDKGKPVVLEDGKVDYRNLNLFVSVSQGDLLVLRTPPIPGVPGVTVTGRKIMPKAGRNYPLPRGKNTVANEDDTQLFAAVDGHVTIVDGKVTVNTVLEIPGDVDYSTGNIDYIGDVRIRGNITTGFTVKAGGDIEVNGVIEGATVTAKGNIVVKNGIAGGHKGLVSAGGSVFARFVENARLEVEGDVVIQEAIIQSVVMANNSVRVEGRKGVIVGGTVQAGEEISARVVGSPLSPQTILEVGINPQLREERKVVYQEYNEKKKTFENLQNYLQSYQKMGVSTESLTPKRKAVLTNMLSEYQALKKELEELDKRRQEIDDELNRLQYGRIKVADVVYPGVQITIGQAQYHVNDPVRFVLFTLKDGDIKIEPLR